jgi:hypothetical protein
MPRPRHLFVLSVTCLSALGEQHSCMHTRQSQEVRSQIFIDHKGAFCEAFCSPFRNLRSAVYCWGFNLFGELGDGTFISRPVEKTILNWPSLDYDQTAILVRDSGRGVRAVVSGHHNTCILANGHCNYGDLACQNTENSKCSSFLYSALVLSSFSFQSNIVSSESIFQGNRLMIRSSNQFLKDKRHSKCPVISPTERT